MDVVVRGKNRPVPRHLRVSAEEKVGRIGRLTHDAGRVEVDFSELRNPSAGACQLCEITVHLKRHFVKAHASATEPEAALDLTLDKVVHQVARIKERRVGTLHGGRRGRPSSGGEAAADGADADGVRVDDIGPGGAVVAGPANGDGRIVRRKRFDVKPMTLDEAALQLEALGHDFYLFTSAESGRAAVLYRRRDGDLGLIEGT